MFRDQVAQDIEKRHEMIKNYKKEIKILNMELGIANTHKGSMSEEKQKQLIELRKTYHDKIQIQTRILGQIMNNLKISTRGSFSCDKYLNKELNGKALSPHSNHSSDLEQNDGQRETNATNFTIKEVGKNLIVAYN